MDNLTEYLNVRIEPDTKNQLEWHAHRRKLKLAQLVRMILEGWLDKRQMAALYGVKDDSDTSA